MRIRFITKNPLQRKYLVLIVLSILLPLFIVEIVLYYLIFQTTAEQLGIPESIAHNLFPVLEKINFILLVGMPPIVILLFVLGALLTHRLIGPLERLEDDLRKIAEGDYSVRFKIRKDDDLKPVADALNEIIDKLLKCKDSDK